MPALSFLRTPQILVFTLLVGAQGLAGYFLNARQENVPDVLPLRTLPVQIGSWQMTKEFPIEPEIQEVLKADDSLSRHYASPAVPNGAYAYINFFKTQRAGVAPHSPKNCLPGNGWVSERNEFIHIQVPGRAEPIEAQYYVVQRGDNKSVVIYWYQSHGRIVASEYWAKFYVVTDAIQHNRTDTSLVKFTMPVGPEGVEVATQALKAMVAEFYGPVSAVLPA